MSRIGKLIFLTGFVTILCFLFPIYAKAEIINLEPEETDDYGIHLIQNEGYVKDVAECTVQFDFAYNKLTLYYYDQDGNFVENKYTGEQSIDIMCSEKSAGGKVQRDDGVWIEFALEISSLDQQAPFQSGYLDRNFDKYTVSVNDTESGVKSYTLNGTVVECNGVESVKKEYKLSEFPKGTESITLSSEDMVGNVREEEVCVLNDEDIAKLGTATEESKDNLTEDVIKSDEETDTLKNAENQNDMSGINESTDVKKNDNDSKNMKGLVVVAGIIAVIAGGGIVFALVRGKNKKSK